MSGGECCNCYHFYCKCSSQLPSSQIHNYIVIWLLQVIVMIILVIIILSYIFVVTVVFFYHYYDYYCYFYFYSHTVLYDYHYEWNYQGFLFKRGFGSPLLFLYILYTDMKLHITFSVYHLCMDSKFILLYKGVYFPLS